MTAHRHSPATPGSTQTTDAYLEAVTVGERLLHNSTIELAQWSPRWQSAYARVAQSIQEALGPRAVRLEHVGSTAVPKLAAKPFIDMLLVVDKSADEDAYLPELIATGFTLRIREPNWHEHRFLVRTEQEDRWQLHVFSRDCEEINRMIRFRDRLRNDTADRLAYESTKIELASRTWRHIQNYADAKSTIIEDILQRADHASGPLR